MAGDFEAVASSRSFWNVGRDTSRKRAAEDAWDALMNDLRAAGWEPDPARRSDYYALQPVGAGSSVYAPVWRLSSRRRSAMRSRSEVEASSPGRRAGSRRCELFREGEPRVAPATLARPRHRRAPGSRGGSATSRIRSGETRAGLECELVAVVEARSTAEREEHHERAARARSRRRFAQRVARRPMSWFDPAQQGHAFGGQRRLDLRERRHASRPRRGSHGSA